VHRFYWYIKEWHTIKSQTTLILHSAGTKQTWHCSHAILGAPSVTTPASFCILISKLCSTFLTQPYRSQPVMVPLTAFNGAYSSVTPNSTTTVQTKQQDALWKIWHFYTTVALNSNLLGSDAGSLRESSFEISRTSHPQQHNRTPDPKLYFVTHMSSCATKHHSQLLPPICMLSSLLSESLSILLPIVSLKFYKWCIFFRIRNISNNLLSILLLFTHH
jgi:hypothetical protein